MNTVPRRRLAGTINWCTARLDMHAIENSLRTPKLRPNDPHYVFFLPEQYSHAGYQADGWHGARADAERVALVESVAAARSSRVGHITCVDAVEPTEPMDGRILLYAPDQTLSDGGEQRDSLGFLDQHNLPAWDTWLYYIPFESAECNKDRGWPQHGGFLVSWVPGELVELINHAMRVNYDYCFVWEDELSGVMPRQPRLFG